MVKVNGREMTKEQFRNYILAEMKKIKEEKEGEEDMREVKKFISIDNKEFDNEKECIDYEQTIIDYIADKVLFKECSECQNYSLCQYLIEKNVCHGNLCSFIMDNIIKEFNK